MLQGKNQSPNLVLFSQTDVSDEGMKEWTQSDGKCCGRNDSVFSHIQVNGFIPGMMVAGGAGESPLGGN